MREFVIPLATGLAIFLFGMQVLRIGLEKLAGKRLERWLHQFTQTPVISFLTGLIATGFLQSSSAVTVLAISFVNARIMRFSRCIGLILGTNVGTSVTTELLVFPIEQYAVGLMLLGTTCWLSPWRNIRFSGLSAAGMGCIFLGMQTMASLANAFDPQTMTSLFTAYDGMEWGVIAGTLLAAIIQSSSATIALMMGLYQAQAISLTFGLAAVLGANVGTCVTAWVASINGERTGKQIAMAHLFINVIGLIAFYPFLTMLGEWISTSGFSHYAQIAHFQTGFNLVSSLALLPFSRIIAQIVQWMLPVSQEK